MSSNMAISDSNYDKSNCNNKINDDDSDNYNDDDDDDTQEKHVT